MKSDWEEVKHAEIEGRNEQPDWKIFTAWRKNKKLSKMFYFAQTTMKSWQAGLDFYVKA